MVKDMERDDWESCKHEKGSVGKKKGWINDFSVPSAIIEARNRLRGEKKAERRSLRETLGAL